MRLVFVTKESLDDWFGKARPILERIVSGSGGRLSSASLRNGLEAGRYWLALAVDDDGPKGCLLAQPYTWETGFRELILMIAGDGFAEWGEFYDEIEKAAVARGFHVLTDANGRPGMKRFVESRGWKQSGVTFEKDLRV